MNVIEFDKPRHAITTLHQSDVLLLTDVNTVSNFYISINWLTEDERTIFTPIITIKQSNATLSQRKKRINCVTLKKL